MPAESPSVPTSRPSRNFIQQIIDADRAKNPQVVVHTRFPPEPNGYLHIGHAKSICLNFGLANEYEGKFNLRFDDTNPAKEEQEYVDSIIDDVRWLGGDWEDRLFFASDYFDQLYDWAVKLVKNGKAYVCDLTAEEMREHRGTLTEPGKDSPYRTRGVEENLDLLERMKAGEFPDGSRTLRAKIDMASPNLNLRDPVMYRVKHAHHHRTGDNWCIYPSYDYTHGQSDSIEGITYSICTLEFENHRPLYDWFIQQLEIHPPRQIEFARLNLSYSVMSKRKLLQLVQEGHVAGWDDPRMLTIRGLRRRGYTPEAMRAFCERIGVAKFNSTIDMAWLEDAIREDLNERAMRRMAVMRPLRVVLTNVQPGEPLELEVPNHPQKLEEGKRKVKMGREIFIEQEDFMEDAPKKFFRLKPGGAVRLRGAGIAICEEVVKDKEGKVAELKCSFNPDTTAQVDGKKVKGTIHWVDADSALDCEVRLYDHLFTVEIPDVAPEGGSFLDNLNPSSLETTIAKLEPSLADATSGESFQFERVGYFVADSVDSKPGKPIFNRTVTLRDTWGKSQRK
ncbi:glutamine--tRNA ligase/YqeY domain fusion protein [Aeoliella sp. ICT_H6.2]|uniref:Glutamine--tRNA ligase n=1 Tax=Aeoliella straminimaris TaxID=2954799 RepID=A0A9X2FFB7_9BACT|nr:glutamine--tRNA ligase/YqeY domain fusion protein [Aeoliella straminimaris]MCO6048137.1 glutamine--tRNA ligase/YqeY domain fusion protein [Aeoliella straminimaris]